MRTVHRAGGSWRTRQGWAGLMGGDRPRTSAWAAALQRYADEERLSQPARLPGHNPWDGACIKHLLGEPTRSGARCPICSEVRLPDQQLADALERIRDYAAEFTVVRKKDYEALSRTVAEQKTEIEYLGKRAAAAERARDQHAEALKDAEGWLTQGQGSPECHHALGIIRKALSVSVPPQDTNG